MRSLRAIARCSIVAALTVGCSVTSSPDPSREESATAERTPAGAASASPGPSVVLVRGHSYCSITSFEARTEAGNDVITEHFSCTYMVSDPRLDGSVEADFITTIQPTEAASGRWEGTVTITNDDGAWSGPAEGALVFWPGRTGPMNYGEGTYEGSGAYKGLIYHELVAGGDSGTEVSGWIEPAPTPRPSAPASP